MEGWGTVVWLLIGMAVGLGGATLISYVRAQPLGIAWIWSLAAALLGGYAWSEWFGKYSTWGPELSGLYVLPALFGAIIVTATQLLATLERAEPQAAQQR